MKRGRIWRYIWEAGGGSGIAVPNPVQFGVGGTADVLELATTGGNALVDSTRIRAVVRGKFTLNYTNDQTIFELHGATVKFRLLRQPAGTIRLTVNGFHATTAGTVAIGSEFVAIASYDAGDGNAYLQVFVDGALTATHEAVGSVAWQAVDLSSVTALSIGGRPVAVDSTVFYQGQISDIRIWLEDTGANNCYPIRLINPATSTVTSYSVSSASALQTTFYSGTAIYAGQSLTFGASTATVESYNSTTGVATMVSPGWTGLLPGTDSPVTHLKAANASDLDMVLLGTTLSTTGAIAGVLPQIYFGGGQTASSWNAGENRGTLAPLTLTAGNID